MIRGLVALSFATLLGEVAFAAEDTSYDKILELKAWPNKIDVYIDAEHSCEGSDRKRYHLGIDRDQAYALLLTGFSGNMMASLHYECSNDGYPKIIGVRVRR